MILDTMMLINDGSLGMSLPMFTVNTAVPEVVATFPGAPNTHYGVFAASANVQKFAAKDSLTIKSVALVLPYCFSTSGPANFGMSWREGGTDYTVPQWGSNGRQWIYTNQVEIDLDLFVPWNPLGAGVTPADLVIGRLDVPISMVGVPASFNGASLPIQIWIKVLHNLTLVP